MSREPAVGRSRWCRFALAGFMLVACVCVVSLSSGVVPTDPPPFEVAPAGHMQMPTGAGSTSP